MDLGLRGLTVAITGANGGIGRALATTFGNEGANIALLAGSKGAELAEWAASQPWSMRCHCGAADVRDPVALDRAFGAARERFGRIDGCVVNAGIWPASPAPLHTMAPERAREVLEINLLGALFTARSFLRELAATGARSDGAGASIVFIGSTAGRFGEAEHAEYAASKAGLIGLMRSLKNEIVALDPGGRVNVVEPGWTVTDLTRATLDAKVIARVTSTMPLAQLARPEDVAAAVVALASPALSRHVSGQIVTVAGGMEGRLLREPKA